MATTKKSAEKSATKKPAAKPAAKKPAAKPAAKKPAAKSPEKKPAAKTAAKPKPAAKPAAAKSSVAKPTAAKPKPAAKSAEKTTATKAKPAVTKPTAAKPATAKSTTTKPTTAKPAVTKPTVEVFDAKYRNLFDAYAQGKLPFAHGYIVSSFFDEKSAYSIYEIVSYAGVKEIYMAGNGLTFVTGGKKVYILIEPDTYRLKHQEPVSRAESERIPKRFAELDILITKNQYKIMTSKEPDESYGSFTIMKPMGLNFSVVFYDTPDMYKTINDFFVNTFNKQRKVPEFDAKKAAANVVNVIEKHMGFEGEFK